MNNQFPSGIIHYKDVSESYIDALIDKLGLRLSADTSELTNIVAELLKTNEKAIEQYKNGNEKALNVIVGQVMKVTKQYDGSQILAVIKQNIDNIETQKNQRNAGKSEVNEYGVPLHACNGYIHNEHYWVYIAEKNRKEPLFNHVKMMLKNTPKGTQ